MTFIKVCIMKNDAVTVSNVYNSGELIDMGNGILVVKANNIHPKVKVKETPGRPVDPNSVRQQRLAKRNQKIEEGGELKRGRPIIEGSDRQQRLQLLDLKKQAGIEIKSGRPRLVTVNLNGQEVRISEGTII